MSELFIGLMSGTSVDAIDTALVNFENNQFELISTLSYAIPKVLREGLFALNHASDNEIHKSAILDFQMGELFAESVVELLLQTKINADEVIAIGSHGQNIRHRPDDVYPYSIQIGNPNVIADLTGITTVCDFRRRDMVQGGQGAPLAPAFHHYLFHDNKQDQLIVNIGGIANITYLPNQGDIIGFDTGPGNCLMDSFIEKHFQQAYDKNGGWARQGKVDEVLLKTLLDDNYFKRRHPKSTGREYFNLQWLDKNLQSVNHSIEPINIQATLLHLTAKSITDVISAYPGVSHVYICGGGAHNLALMDCLQYYGQDLQIDSTESLGLAPDWVEACLFAWLAKQTLAKQAGNIPSVTGAEHPVILGGIYY